MGYRKLSARPRHHAQDEGRSRLLKKLPRPPGRDRARKGGGWHADRNLVCRTRLGSARRTRSPADGRSAGHGLLRPRSADQLDLYLRRHLPEARQGRRPRPAALQHRAMNLHLAEIARTVAPGKHAVLLLDQAGWHLSTRLVVPPTSRSCRCRRNVPNSTRSKTSGSSCAKIGYPTASSTPTTISSTTAARPGTSSSISHGTSCPSDCATGRIGSDQ